MPKYKAHMRKALKATFKMQDWGVGLEDAVLRRIILQATEHVAWSYLGQVAGRSSASTRTRVGPIRAAGGGAPVDAVV